MWSVWFVFVTVVFILSALWWIRIRGLWKLPDGRNWLRGKLGLVLMLSKSLIQFSLDGQGCIPSLLFDLSPNYDGGNEDNAHSFKGPQACTSGLSAPDPEAGHHHPTLPHTILDTHEQVWVSLMFGHCFFLLCPGVHKVLLPPKSPSPQSCVSSGSCVMGLMATSSKRVYGIPRSAAPRAPVPVAGNCWPIPPQETFKNSSGSVFEGSLGPGAHKVCLSPPCISGEYGVWF